MLRLGIIGGGLSGSLLIIRLMRKLEIPAEILLFEKEAAQAGRGVAYACDFVYQPLNVRVGHMSLYSETPDHLFDWLSQRPDAGEVDREQFIHRGVFGEYLQDEMRLAWEQKHPAVHLRTVLTRVVDIQPAKTGQLILCEDGTSYTADKVILATGNQQPLSLPCFDNTERCIRNPWNRGWLSRVDRDMPVAIIGAGLTMVDIVCSLMETGHRGKIHVLSRRGRWPRNHTSLSEPAYPISTPPPSVYESALGALKYVRAEIMTGTHKGYSWHTILDAMRPYIPRIWQAWPDQERARFLRHLRCFWDPHRHRIPDESFRRLESGITSGQLIRHSGRILDITDTDAGTAVLRYQDRKSGKARELEATLIVNCTGPNPDLTAAEDPLFKNLFDRELIHTDSLRLGIRTNEAGTPIKADGLPLMGIYCLGPLLVPYFFESTALREIRQQVERLADYLLTQTAVLAGM